MSDEIITAVAAEKAEKKEAPKQTREEKRLEKLMMLKEAADEKTRRKQGRGIALLATCVIPIFLGAALDSLGNTQFSSYPLAIIGVGAMFLMIGLGVYDVTAASGEKKSLSELLKDD